MLYTVKARQNGYELGHYYNSHMTYSAMQTYCKSLMTKGVSDLIIVIGHGRAPGDDKVIGLWEKSKEGWVYS